MYFDYLIKIIFIILFICATIYLFSILEKKTYKIRTKINDDKNNLYEEELYDVENICSKIDYYDTDDNQTTLCPVKIKDLYDSKVEELSNFENLKKNNKNEKQLSEIYGHLGKKFNNNIKEYENETPESGGIFYKYNDSNVYAYDASENEAMYE